MALYGVYSGGWSGTAHEWLEGGNNSRSDAERSATDSVGDDQWPSAASLIHEDYTEEFTEESNDTVDTL